MRRRWLLGLLVVMALLAAACGGDDDDSGSEGTGGDTTGDAAGGGVCAETDASGDLLAEICETGTIRVSTDPAYPPQSSLNEETEEYEGFDIDVATEIANRLGVEVAWEAPAWDVITAGSWNGRWDMSVGSMTPTNERQTVLDFTAPYYFTPAVVMVHEDNTSVADLSTDLDGATIGVCSACTYDFFLQKTLEIEGFEFDFIIDDAEITGYDTDTTALQDLALGDGTRLDAAITSLTVAQGYAAENPVKIVGDPVFFEPLAVAFDKSSELDGASLVAAVNQIVDEMHTDGTLTSFSEEWFDGVDLTTQ
ncbi:MAG: transporter substrate-binding domain-containing protein [Acidimicrobiia bacterium]